MDALANSADGGTDRRVIVVAGYGMAGQIYAGAFHRAGAQVIAVDRFASDAQCDMARSLGLPLLREWPDSFDHVDVLIILTPASAGPEVTRLVAAMPGDFPVLDLTSAAPDAMRDASLVLGTRFVDGTVLGAVGLGGVATPMVFAGPQAEKVAQILSPLGCRISCISDTPGDASKLKLLRSLFMKGLEALVVETSVAARGLDLTDHLPLALSDIFDLGMGTVLAEMLRTHPKHAIRRKAEIDDAVALMQSAGLEPVMAKAATCLFARTAAAGPGPDSSPDAAASWLFSTANTEPAQ